MKTFLCQFVLSCLVHPSGPMPVDDLHYGEVLYSYYQEDYHQALVDTLVAETRGQQGDDPLRFELAEGTFAFDDGMYKYARGVFDGIDPGVLTDLDKLRLSFHSAREFFRREDWPAVSREIANIDLGRTWYGRSRRHPEVEFMRAELATHAGDFERAELALKQLDEENPFRAYGLFNLGVALHGAGDLERSGRVFDDVSELEGQTREVLDLVQRSKVAGAFINKELNAYADAAGVLGRLPTKSRYRDMALATYGGLAMQQEDYELASKIWMTLQNEKHWTPSTATARLGFPISLEHLASDALALTYYRAAEESFEDRLGRLVQLTERADDPRWVGDLLEVFSTPERDQDQAELVAKWRDELGHTDWLEWLSTEDTHKLLVQWRTLNEYQGFLDDLPERMDIYQGVAEEQKLRAQTARNLIGDEDVRMQRDWLALRARTMIDRLADLEQAVPERTATWMLKIATPEEAELIEQFAAMRAVVDRGVPGAERRAWLARIDRLEGMLYWRLVDVRPARVRGLEKSLAEVQTLLGESDVSMVRIRNAEAAFIAGVEADFVMLKDRAIALADRVDMALGTRQEMLAKQLRDGMQREMQQVRNYLVMTRIAIARTSDKLAFRSDQPPRADARDGLQ